MEAVEVSANTPRPEVDEEPSFLESTLLTSNVATGSDAGGEWEENEEIQEGKDVEEPYKMNIRSSKYQAELQLLTSLSKPRRAQDTTRQQRQVASRPATQQPWLSEKEQMLQELKRPKYLEMSKEELESFRPTVPRDLAHSRKELDLDVSLVSTLPRQVKASLPSNQMHTANSPSDSANHNVASSIEGGKRLERVKDMNASRQVRHDKAVKEFQESVVLVSEQLEKEVIERGRDLRDRLEKVDKELEERIKHVKDEARLRMEEYDYVAGAWETLESLCNTRKEAIKQFERDLEQVEERRAAMVSQELGSLVDKLTQIGYKLRGEIERLVENEAHEVNLVLISNTKIKTSLIARMLKKHVLVFHETRKTWEQVETTWRSLRHERALEEWTQLLDSEQFCNPQKRIDIIQAMEQDQLSRHRERRVELFRELERLTGGTENLAHSYLESSGDQDEDPQGDAHQQQSIPISLPDFSVERIKDIQRRLEALDAEEKACIEKVQQELDSQQQEMYEEMVRSRECLRAELHSYAMLAEDGDLFTYGERGNAANHRVALGKFLADTSLDDFFRKAGGLKPELVSIVNTLAKPELIYNEHVAQLFRRVKLLVESLDILRIKEEQGKLSAVKNLEAMLEKLRTARKADLPPLVPKFYAQIRAFNNDDMLGASVHTELDLALESLEKVDSSLTSSQQEHEGQIDGSQGRPASGNSQAHETVDAESDNQADTVQGMDDEETSSTTTGEPGLTGTPAELAYKEKPFNLPDLRNAQKRVGTVIHASRLPELIQTELRGIYTAMENQRVANERVDQVIQGHCDSKVARREMEVECEKVRIIKHISEQRDRLQANCTAFCEYFATIAAILEAARQTEEQTDVHYENALDNLADTFEEQDSQREEAFKQIVHELRHAPDQISLEKHFRQALQVLEEIDCGYRDYHRDGVKISKAHPQQANEEAIRHHDLIASHFGLEQISYEDSHAILDSTPERQAQPLSEMNSEPVSEIDTEHQPEGEKEHLEDEQQNQGQDQEAKEDEQEQVEPETSVSRAVTPVDANAQVNQGTEPPVLQFFNLFRFRLHKSPEEIGLSILHFKPVTNTEDDVQDDEEEEGPEGEEDQISESVDSDVYNHDTDEHPSDPESLQESKVAEDEEAKEEEEVEVEESPTANESTTHCFDLTSIQIDLTLVRDCIQRVRDAILVTTCESRRQRMEELERICVERCEEYTEELEERLRLHWPRKGRTDVKYQQPRAGELLQHQQRHDRHVRAVNLKNRAQEQQFHRKLEKAGEAMKKFKQFMNGLTLHLEAQNNVAALQGILKKGKTASQTFQSTMQQLKEDLLPFVRRSNELLEMNGHFLGTCTTFQNGGDYNEEEIKIEEASLQKLEEAIVQALASRAEQLQTLFSEAKEIRLVLSNKFQSDFERCLQALSVREGLGQKYGAPRRIAQEKLRSEIASSDNAQAYVEQVLSKLEKALQNKDSTVSTSPKPLSRQVKEYIDVLRKCIFHRGQYLEIFANPNTVVAPEPIQLQDSKEEDPFFGATEQEVSHAVGFDTSVGSTFWAVIQDANQACQSQTRELYEKEGMLDDLNESGTTLVPNGPLLPESLVSFLKEFEHRAQQYKEVASARLREQVQKLMELLLLAPSAVLDDIASRCKESITTSCQELQDAFQRTLEESEQLKTYVEGKMRPSLGDPNHQIELGAVCTVESNRSKNVLRELYGTHKQLVQVSKRQTSKVIQDMSHSFESLIGLLNTCVLPSDLRTLPQDELVVTKRMGLKRLRKLREKLEDDGDSQAKNIRALREKHWPGLQEEMLIDKVSAFVPLCEQMDNEDTQEDTEEGADVTLSGGFGKAMTTVSTPQHKAAFQARADSFSAYVEWFDCHCSRINERFNAQLEKEMLWAKHWKHTVKTLQE